MGKLILALLVGLVGAAVVHIGVILAMPRIAEDSAWSRLSARGALFETDILEAGSGPFTFVDPAFDVSTCRFSSANGPVHLTAEPSSAFWTASLFSPSGDNIYSINQRAALDDTLDIMLGTQEQFDQLRLAGTFDENASIFVPFDAVEGYVVLRGVVEAPSLADAASRFVGTLQCRAEPLPPT